MSLRKPCKRTHAHLLLFGVRAASQEQGEASQSYSLLDTVGGGDEWQLSGGEKKLGKHKRFCKISFPNGQALEQ